jgi:hypothetical protein
LRRQCCFMLPHIVGGQGKTGSPTPGTKEFAVLMENRPSIRGRICQTLAYQEVNILALESFPTRGKFVTRFIVNNSDTARAVLNNEKLTYAEEDHPNYNSTSARRNSEAGIPSGESENQYHLRLLWFGAIYDCGFGLLRRHGSRQGRLSSRAVRSRREALKPADLFLSIAFNALTETYRTHAVRYFTSTRRILTPR